MNVLVGKTATIRFTEIKIENRTWGGVDYTALMYVNMAKAYPQHTFYYLGPGSWKGLNDCPTNLINLYNDILKETGVSGKYLHYKDVYNYIEKHNLKFDKAIVLYCQTVAVTEWDEGILSSKGTPRIMRICDRRVSFILSTIKHFNIPAYYFIDDVREISHLPYDIPQPTAIYSQLNGIDKSYYLVDNDMRNAVIKENKIEYRPIEMFWLQAQEKFDWRGVEKNKGFVMFLNGALGRYEYITKWLFEQDPSITIYGDWEGINTVWERIKSDGRADNFKKIPMSDMDDVANYRYTLVVPPTVTKSCNYPAFVTQKLTSMMYYGIIPFYCPADYDTGGIYDWAPEYLKVNSPEEMFAKMQELDNDEAKYKSLLEEIWNCLRDEMFDYRFMYEVYDGIL